jgi:hypothetical protein
MKARTKSARPKLVRISDEMKQWSAMLEHELSDWPDVSSRPMFGFLSFYRKGAIFAALPQTRGVGTPNSFMFRFASMPADLLNKARKSGQIRLDDRSPSAKWYIFELNSERDLRDALWWLNQAYEIAAKSDKQKVLRAESGRS